MLTNEIIVNGQTLISLRADTVAPEYVKEGITFHDRTGATHTGTYVPPSDGPVLLVTVTGQTATSVTATLGSKSVALTYNSTIGKWWAELTGTGTWTVTATGEGNTATTTVAATAVTVYEVEMAFGRVFGVMWNYASTSTALTRLTKANDPNGLVNVDITTVPSPAVGTGSGSSPFDNYAPWKNMVEYNIINNAVSHKKGDSGFSRTSNDTVVLIPEYYFKIVNDTANSKLYYYIADTAKTGFTKHPGSGKYVGRYNTGASYVSKSGLAPLVSITRPAARTGSKGKGSKWSQYDFASWCAVWLLYLVEFADWNSQSKIGRGYVDGNSSAINSGGTDSMTYHTGRPAGTDGKTAVQYRWIENPWGNVYEWIDGINFSGRKAYVCTTPANYADDTSTNYTDTGITLPSSGWIKGLGVSSNAPWAFLPNTNGGSETTYVSDYVYSDTGWRVLFVGGFWRDGTNAGLFCFAANNTSLGSSGDLGARLLFHP